MPATSTGCTVESEAAASGNLPSMIPRALKKTTGEKCQNKTKLAANIRENKYLDTYPHKSSSLRYCDTKNSILNKVNL